LWRLTRAREPSGGLASQLPVLIPYAALEIDLGEMADPNDRAAAAPVRLVYVFDAGAHPDDGPRFSSMSNFRLRVNVVNRTFLPSGVRFSASHHLTEATPRWCGRDDDARVKRMRSWRFRGC
jgi:hypothetical protein